MAVNSTFRAGLREYERKVARVSKLGMQDVLDDLVRTSSQSAPHDEGILEKAWTSTLVDDVGTVSFTARKGGSGGNYNYALKMHETSYKLGTKSLQKVGGTGMSGQRYPVGKGYLGNVLRGEESTYKAHIEQMVKNI